MSKWTFFGKVLPERVPITWATPLEGRAEATLGCGFKFRVAIHHSQIVVDLEVTESASDLATLRNYAGNLVRMITDLLGYQSGSFFDVEIISAVSQETNEWA